MNIIKPTFRNSLWIIRMSLLLLFPPLLIFESLVGYIVTLPFGACSDGVLILLGYILSVCGVCAIYRGIYRGTTFEVGPASVVHTMDFICSKRKEVSLKNIKEVELKSGFLQKLFGLGTIVIHTQASTSGNTKTGLSFSDIENSTKIYDLLNQHMSKAV